MNKGFKMTEVGMIPEEWDTSRLGECASFRTGPFGSALHKSDYINDGIPIVNPIHIVAGRIEPTRTMTITEQTADSLADFRLKIGEIVIGRRGEMGRCAVVQTHQLGWLCGTGSMIIRCSNRVNVEFLQRILSSPQAISSIMDSSVGTTMINLNQGTLAGLPIPLPPLPEQTAIAAALSDMDALIAQTEKLLQKKKAIKQGLMQELLRPKEGWVVRRLGEIGEVKMCKRVFNYQTESLGIIPFYKIGTFGKEADAYISEELYQIYRSKFSFPKEGDILISAAGTIGRTIVYDGKPAYFQDSNIVWIDNNENLVSNKYLYYILQIIKYNTEGGTIQRLYNSILRNANFVCPPKAKQNHIAQILSDADAEIQALETKIEKLQAQKQGMMQVLLTGKIRLV